MVGIDQPPEARPEPSEAEAQLDARDLALNDIRAALDRHDDDRSEKDIAFVHAVRAVLERLDGGGR